MSTSGQVMDNPENFTKPLVDKFYNLSKGVSDHTFQKFHMFLLVLVDLNQKGFIKVGKGGGEDCVYGFSSLEILKNEGPNVFPVFKQLSHEMMTTL